MSGVFAKGFFQFNFFSKDEVGNILAEDDSLFNDAIEDKKKKKSKKKKKKIVNNPVTDIGTGEFNDEKSIVESRIFLSNDETEYLDTAGEVDEDVERERIADTMVAEDAELSNIGKKKKLKKKRAKKKTVATTELEVAMSDLKVAARSVWTAPKLKPYRPTVIAQDISVCSEQATSTSSSSRSDSRNQSQSSFPSPPTSSVPFFLSHTDQEVDETTKRMRRFGQGKNFVAIGPAKKRDPTWSSSIRQVSCMQAPSTNGSSALHSNPFSFGFG